MLYCFALFCVLLVFAALVYCMCMCLHIGDPCLHLFCTCIVFCSFLNCVVSFLVLYFLVYGFRLVFGLFVCCLFVLFCV